MIQRAFRYGRKLHDELRQTEHIYIVLVAVGIGLLGGLGAVGFRELIGLGQKVAWGRNDPSMAYFGGLDWRWKVIVPGIGGLIVGLIIHYFAREAKGHGVPEVMEAVALRGGRIRPRVVIAKLLASGVCIASGGSVGREGPIVQIGSTLGSSIGQWLRINEKRLRTMVGCGAAAGIAGTFNAPVAGALFAVEVILGDFGVPQFSPIVISSVAATVVSRHFLGNFPAFEVPIYEMHHPLELLAYVLLGIVAGLVAFAFIKTLYASEDFFDRVKIFPPIKTLIGGVLIGIIALWLPQVFGLGYEAINAALEGETVLHLMLILVLVKVVAVSITIGSGGSGGIFAPSLFIGAMLGGAVGSIVNTIWPGAVAGSGAYALVGMGAVVAAGTHAPITAILIIFELTGSYKIILPLMISCIISTLLAMRLSGASIYTLKLLRRGIEIRGGHDINVLRHLSVQDVMRREIITVSPEAHLMAIVSEFINNPSGSAFVVDDRQRLLGIIAINNIRPILKDISDFENLIIARDLMAEGEIPSVHHDDSLDEVMKRLGKHRGEVPVLEDGKVVGAIWPEDVIQRYNAEIFKRDMAHGMSTAVQEPSIEPLDVVAGMSLAEIPVPGRFLGKTPSVLNIRKEYGVSILLIKHKASTDDELLSIYPAADYVFREGDVMLAMGPNENLRRLESMG